MACFGGHLPLIIICVCVFVELRVLRFQENPFKVNGELVVAWFCGQNKQLFKSFVGGNFLLAKDSNLS